MALLAGFLSFTSSRPQLVKNLPAMQEMWIQSLGWEDTLEKGLATHSSILSWRIPWTVWSKGSQGVGHDWVTFTFTGQDMQLACPLTSEIMPITLYFRIQLCHLLFCMFNVLNSYYNSHDILYTYYIICVMYTYYVIMIFLWQAVILEWFSLLNLKIHLWCLCKHLREFL